MKPVINSVLAWPDQEFSVAQPFTSSQSGNNSHVLAGYATSQGKDLVYVMAPLKNGEWVLAFQQSSVDAFRDLHDARKVVALVVLIGGLTIFITAFVLSRKTVRHIKRADSEKEMMNEQVIETGKMASIGELAAGIAHEINNPVAVMVEEAGWLDDLLEEEDFKDSKNLTEFQRALHQIKIQGVRCREITHKLLSFARKTDPHVREIQINDLVSEVVDISEQKARYSSIKINRYFAPDLPVIQASPTELQQIILNLINNAVDAIGTKGGTIDVCTKDEEGHVVVSVSDTGEGIPQAILGRIFDPFFTTKPVGKGTGLGLSICYGIVNKMEGSISVSSAVGIGTAFHVRIPVKTE
ncbi:MAG: sensor histidine kinase [Syntrophobacteraceae bacterium]